MKIRIGFVSNSSSSSFCIRKDKITAKQLDDLMSHSDHPNCGEDDIWSIYEEGNYIHCSVFLDNFDLVEYAIEELDIKEEDIKRCFS